jgi:acyl-CoA synthetase (AMP-forming)/AMP-acid ligase II
LSGPALVQAFLDHAEARPDQAALIDGRGRSVSYGELARMSAARASAFARSGVEPGAVVLVARGVSAELYAGLLALFRLGAVALFPEPAAGLEGLALAVETARPTAMIAGPLGRAVRELIPGLRRLPLLSEPDRGPGDGPLAAMSPEAPALMTFTSGSTGRPKGIVRAIGLLEQQHRLLERIRGTTPDDVDLISLPVFVLSNLAAGATSVLPAGDLRRPARLDSGRLARQIADHGVRRVIAPPAVCARLVAAPAGLCGLDAVFTGGGPVFPNLLKALRAAAPRAALHAVYGSTEAEPIAHLSFDEIGEREWRAMAEGAGLLAGRPVPEAKIALRDGEIEVCGPHVVRGYLDPAHDAQTKRMRDGLLWHRTGDAGRIDGLDRLWLLGRREAASEGLFPFAIETAALSWPGVRQAALLAQGPRAELFAAGDRLDAAELTRRARSFGDIRCQVVRSIPTDRRHNSKVDYTALRRLSGQ